MTDEDPKTYNYGGGTLTSNVPGFKLMGGAEIVATAAEALGATPADIPGLWNLAGYPELTSGQLVGIYFCALDR